VGLINSRNEVQRVSTWMANPVLGDILAETDYTEYERAPSGVTFPLPITQREGGHRSLDLFITAVEVNIPVDTAIPDSIRNASPPPARVDVEKIGNGIYYLCGGTYHSVAIEMSDQVVLIEAPVDEERSLALMRSVAEAIPGKRVRTAVNTIITLTLRVDGVRSAKRARLSSLTS